jgi:hypothetical protein
MTIMLARLLANWRRYSVLREVPPQRLVDRLGISEDFREIGFKQHDVDTLFVASRVTRATRDVEFAVWRSA